MKAYLLHNFNVAVFVALLSSVFVLAYVHDRPRNVVDTDDVLAACMNGHRIKFDENILTCNIRPERKVRA